MAASPRGPPPAPTPGGVYVVADTREAQVYPFFDDAFPDIPFARQQINTGDYLVCRAAPDGGAEVLACVERKTWADFAGSFADGRYANVQKMLDLRARTGCQLYYLLEGPAFPAPTRRFGRIPFASIEAAVFKLLVAHGVYVLHAEDQRHTACRLYSLARAFEKYRSAGAPPPGPAPPGPVPPSPVGLGPAAPGRAPAELVRVLEPSDEQAATDVWARLKGISVVLGRLLVREFSVADLAAKRIEPARLAALRSATGRKINDAALRSLTALRAGTRKQEAKVVSGVRGITPEVAERLLEHCRGLAALVSYTAASLGMASIQQKSRTVRLGEKKAARILHVLTFAARGPAPALPAAPTLLATPTALGGPALPALPRVAPPRAASPADSGLGLDDLYTDGDGAWDTCDACGGYGDCDRCGGYGARCGRATPPPLTDADFEAFMGELALG